MSVETFREQYQQTEIGSGYNGYVHFTFTVACCVTAIAYCIASLENINGAEWLTPVVTFLYANLTEYFGHRGPMHNPRRGLGLIYRRHTKQHHRFFIPEHMSFTSHRDFKAVLFPPVMIVFFFGCFALPIGVLIGGLLSDNVAYLFVLTAIGYFLNYELFHFAYHMPEDSWLMTFNWMKRLRHLHWVHHDPRFMQTHNFNITYPIGDWLFGTYKNR